MEGVIEASRVAQAVEGFSAELNGISRALCLQLDDFDRSEIDEIDDNVRWSIQDCLMEQTLCSSPIRFSSLTPRPI